jgi:hypothetical protein
MKARHGLVPHGLRAVLLAVGAIWASHRALVALAARPFQDVLSGYADAELLAAGGDLLLQLVVIHEQTLGTAIVAAGLWLLAARALAFVASFWLHSAAFGLASAEGDRRSGPAPLHIAWALLLLLSASLLETGVLVSLAWGLVHWARWLRQAGVSDWLGHLAWATALCALLWSSLELWLDLFRLAIAGARQRPLAGGAWAGRTWLRYFGRLLSLRAALLVATAAITASGVLLLPAVTQGGADQRFWAALAIDVGLVASLCLRAAWLTWASAHLQTCPAAALRPANYEDAAPSAEPAAPVDPNPNPDA